MGLKPLEFADCLLDSPYFRENIHDHERELEQTNEAIKGLIKECKALLKATESKILSTLCLSTWYRRILLISAVAKFKMIKCDDLFRNLVWMTHLVLDSKCKTVFPEISIIA